MDIAREFAVLRSEIERLNQRVAALENDQKQTRHILNKADDYDEHCMGLLAGKKPSKKSTQRQVW